MRFSFSRRRQRVARAARQAVQYATESLEQRLLLTTTYVVTNVNDSGSGSLRDAITQANENPGLDVIQFDIPGSGVHTIAPETQLPPITDSVFIDGTTQPGFSNRPLIELDGSSAGLANGLEFRVGDNTVQGLDIHSFAYDGIVFADIYGASAVGGNTVYENYLGTDPTGLIAEPNGQDGINLVHSPDNTIKENLISGNAASGIYLGDSDCTGNTIEGNYIGTDVSGLRALGNGLNGVALGAPLGDTSQGYPSNNLIGGPDPEYRNIISGNAQSGIWIQGGSGNKVQGNYIGVGDDGTTPVGNGTQGDDTTNQWGADGVFIDSASGNVIGGVDEGDGNVISANKGDGVRIDGLTLSAEENKVQGNLIGTDSNGNAGNDLGNLNGVEVRNDSNNSAVMVDSNEIGGNDNDGDNEGNPTARNVLSGNRNNGINVAGNVSNTLIEGNYIGTDATGLKAAPNQAVGVLVDALTGQTSGPTNTSIGGDQPLAGNLISGNAGDAIFVDIASSVGVFANIIGPDKMGKAVIGNGGTGVNVFSASNVHIGATATVDGESGPVETSFGNIISGNGVDGVEMAEGSQGNYVVGNFIGSDFTGNAVLGNGRNGITIADSTGTTIGGTTAPSRNVIVGSTEDAVLISGSTATLNLVEGNYIGLSYDGKTALGNTGNGVEISGAPDNVIGGTDPTERNFISHNNDGVLLESGANSTVIEDNYVGTDSSGSFNAAFGNFGSGVGILDSSDCHIIANTLRGNGVSASGNITISASSPSGTATGNEVFSNIITNGELWGVDIAGPTSGNTIGGAPSLQNVISKNPVGIEINTGANGNSIEYNGIGTDESGNYTDGFGNTQDGIQVFSANNEVANNTIVDNSEGIALGGNNNTVSGNVITHNQEDGIDLSGGTGNLINLQNVISDNDFGIAIDLSAAKNTVQGNFIGTDPTGAFDASFGNYSDGISIDDANTNTIEGNKIRGNNSSGIAISGDEAYGNVIDGNAITNNANGGVNLFDSAYSNFVGQTIGNQISANSIGVDFSGGAHDNSILENDIGTDATGAFAAGLGNTVAGIQIEDASNNTVRSNVIRGNNIGMFLTSGGTKNTIDQNQITNSTDDGIVLFGATQETIGGIGNLISNNPDGISIEDEAQQNTILNNDIGTDSTGAFSTSTGNTDTGITINEAAHNTISNNTIRGNGTDGVLITGSDSQGNQLAGNVITNNYGNGVDVTDNASNNTIGSESTASNQISLNTLAGVFIESGTGNAIEHNQIFDNGGLGIDLAPVGVNDNQPPGSSATGPNNLQNFPVLTLATTGGSQRVAGSLQIAPNSLYLLEFFDLDEPDPSGYGQGDRYLTSTAVTTNASGVASFNVTLPAGVAANTFISATATDSGGNTSEFSNTVRVETDTDGDGIPDDMEVGAPNGGDANDDGIPDSEQANVASFVDPLTNQYITLVLPSGMSFSNVTPVDNPSPDDAPEEGFDLGFFNFTINGVAPGGSVAVQMILPEGTDPLSYERYGPTSDDTTPHWYTWTYNGQTGADINGNLITLHFVDGGYGDDDLTANGMIVDPGAPTFPYRIMVTNTNDSGPGSLRQAILDANNYYNDATIAFDIPGAGVHTIEPLSTLPATSTSVTIDGTTQPGYAGKPLIDIDGLSAPGSGLIIGAPDSVVRGLDITDFSDYGIALLNSGSSYFQRPLDFDIEGNYLGTDPTGMLAMPNRWGIGVLDGFGVIGGTTAAAQNVISGNTLDGISVTGGYDVQIEGNLIGVAADGVSPLGNQQDGVQLSYEAETTTVGGTDPGDGNIIAYNQGAGIANYLPDNNNAFLSNSIYSNKYIGITDTSDYMIRVNDSGQTDGSNFNPQNYPVLDSAMSSGGQTTISGYLNSTADSTFTIQFFSNPTTTISGFGQGQTYLGSTTIETDDNGHADFTATLDVAVPFHQLITATATNTGNNITSEFSIRLAVGDVLGSVYIVNTTDDTDDGFADPAHTTLRDAILSADNHPGLNTIEFDIGSGLQTISPLTPLPPITGSVIIDGTTQPGYDGTPLIQISGAKTDPSQYDPGAVANTHLTGLALFGDGSTIKGLDINDFYNFGSNSAIWGGVAIAIFGNNNVVQRNFLGTDVTGTRALPNYAGVNITGNGNLLGGSLPGQGNLVSGNFYDGVSINGSGNTVEGNFVGTDITGTKGLGNGRGVEYDSFAIQVSQPNVIDNNVISGNLGNALQLENAQGSVVQGNFIGTDLTGTRALPNLTGADGIDIDDDDYDPTDPGVTIGGAGPGEGNVISNNRVGIFILSGWNDVIQGNRIGTDITGTLNFGNSIDGIDARGANGLIGGTNPGEGNIISANGRFGILLSQVGAGATTSGDLIAGNLIGTASDGITPLGNGSDGIAVASDFEADSTGPGPVYDTIGGDGGGNVIAFNGRDGVDILDGQDIGILSNSIYSNGFLGIDLGGDGVTPNDPQDTDSGDNGLQNFPVITAAVSDGVHTTITGTFNSTPDSVFYLQFFANPSADPSGYGEGQTLLGTRQILTDDSGNASFTLSFPVGVAAGQFVSATATDSQSDTSEFSADFELSSGTVTPNQPPTAITDGPYTINEGDSLSLDGSLSTDPDGDPLTYSWDINGDGVFGDATGVQPTLNWAQLVELGIVNGPSTFTVRLQVDDGQGHVVTSAPTTLTVLNVAPIVNAGFDQYVNEGDTVTLSGSFTDPGTADTHTIDWHIVSDNGQVIPDSSDLNYSFIADDNGVYTATLTVTDSDGGVGSGTLTIYVSNVDPSAVIVGLPTVTKVGVPLNLSAIVTDPSPVDTAAGFQYAWDVALENVGPQGGSQAPTFTFTPTVDGLYNLSFYVEDKDGGTDIIDQAFNVVGTLPADTAPSVALSSGYAEINEGSLFSTIGAFADPDPGDSWTATVDYGDGSGSQPLALNPDKTFDLAHTYATYGSYDVSITVTDKAGMSGSADVYVNVDDVAPVVTLNNPSTATVGTPFTLAGSFVDPGTETWSATVDYGDGDGPQPLALNSDKTFQLSHTYTAVAPYTVTVTVTDDGGLSGSQSVSFLVLNTAPQVLLTANPAAGTYGETTTLSATFAAGGTPLVGETLSFSINGNPVGTAITDSTGTATLSNVSLGTLDAGSATISVSFAGDAQNAATSATATLSIAKAPLVVTVNNASRVYGQDNPSLTGTLSGILNNDDFTANYSTTATSTSEVGSYAITATLADPDGRLSNYIVTINSGTLTVLATTLTASGNNVTAQEGSLFSGVVATFTSNNPIATAGDFGATINWGDGHSSPGTVLVASGGGFEVTGSNTYADHGTYPISVTIRDNAGQGTASPTAQASVADVAPTVFLDNPTATAIGTPFTLSGSFSDPGDNTWTATVDYGDGSGPQPLALAADKSFVLSHTYASTGTYNVKVTVTDDAGQSGASSVSAVINPVQTSLIASPAAATYGGTTSFSATLTSAGNPLAGRTLLFALNGISIGSAITNATGTAVLSGASIGSLAAGSALISVSFAGDGQDVAASGTATLSIAKAPLTVTANNASRVYGQSNPTLTGSLSGLQNDDNITATYSTAATSGSPVGSYAINATLTDPDGRLSNYIVTINSGTLTVLATTLTASGDNVTTQEGSAFSGVVATFTSNNPIATVGDFAATINWGDGHSSAGTVLAASGGGFEVTGNNIYADHGSYSISITIQDNAGHGSASPTAQASVADVAPTVSLNTPTATTIGTPFTLSGSFSDPGENTWIATVDYGDNSGLQPLALAANKTFTLSHMYVAAGSFTITVTVTDDAGESGTASVSETVNKLQTSLAAAPATATYGGTTTLSATLTASGNPLAGKTLLFSLNGISVGTAITGSTGAAVLSNVSIGTLGAGSATITVSFAEDGQDTAAAATATLSIAKAALVVTVGSASRVYGQSNPALTGTISGIEDGDNITANYSTSAASTSPVGTYPITATLNDPGGRLANYNLTVNNGTLTVLKTTLTAVGQNISSSEGSSFSGVVATFTTNNPIAAASDFAVTINWGNGQTSTGTVSAVAGGGFQVAGSVTYADNGTYPISISIQDNVGLGAASATAQANVANVPPTPTINGAPATANAGSTISLTATATDPSPVDTAAGFTFAWQVTETGNGSTTNVASGSGPAFSFIPATAGVYTVTLKATDKDGGAGTTSRTITVTAINNVAPVVSITGPASAAAYSVGCPVTFTGKFTDPDSPGAHTAIWTFTSPGLPTISILGVVTANGMVTATYTFHSAAVYQITLSVTDSGGATGRSSMIGSAPAEVAIYDQNAGAIAGAGSFNSPAGAETANPKFTGNACFAFAASYTGCSTVPVGLFTFSVDKLSFCSTCFNWLVINGSKAELEGTGIANGHSYSFLLTFIDGKAGTCSNPIRIKIWNPANGSVIYDNEPGAADWADPLTPLADGDVLILKKP